MFVHDVNNEQLWVVGAKEILSNKFRLDIINARNAANLKIFVENIIEPDTKIVTDGWTGYSFLDDSENSVFKRKVILVLVYQVHHISKTFGKV